MLTALKPLKKKLIGHELYDVYMVPGDPVGYLNMCKLATGTIMKAAQSMRPFDTVEVDLHFNPIKEVETLEVS